MRCASGVLHLLQSQAMRATHGSKTGLSLTIGMRLVTHDRHRVRGDQPALQHLF